ncbi:MAG TPA: glycosyltransferase family 39 protein, partial [candidate division Zixibacteria bacterium]|nr:glycosyltransferase family 39 protein [candidate division Zixibacteria bacterium]
MKDRSRFFPIAFALLLLIAFGLRVYALEADAPHHLSVSQGLTTDGANTVYGGRNKVIFGQWTPEIEGFSSVESTNSAMLWLSYYTFSLLGTGYWQAGFLAVVLGLLTISVVAAFARQHFGQRVALLAAVFLAFNYAFVIYNRLPVAFTLVGLVMALILFTMGRSPGKPLYVLLAIALAVFGFVSVKVAAIASIPIIIVGISVLLYR